MNQELIEQYIAGRLDETEAEAFEVYCVGHPEFAKQVEFEQRLKAGLAAVARGSTAEFVRSDQPVRWKLAMAASVFLVLSSAFVVWRVLVPSVRPAILAAVTTDSQHNGAALRLALVRGAENAPVLQSGQVRVEIVGLFDSGFHYSVALERLENKKNVETVATLYSQHPTSPVTLELMIDSDRLRPGAYSLRVRKQASDEEALDFGFMKF
jgi:hypothetical protein